jgi:hypothetical protein
VRGNSQQQLLLRGARFHAVALLIYSQTRVNTNDSIYQPYVIVLCLDNASSFLERSIINQWPHYS